MTIIRARIRKSDGKTVRIHPDGREGPFPPHEPMHEMTDEEVEAAALSDPDNPPHDFSKMRRVPWAKTLRRGLDISQEEFAERYRIPLGTLRDWEQGRSEPDAPARAYLTVIAMDAKAIAKMLETAPRR
jgi:putative transcriptional regulator